MSKLIVGFLLGVIVASAGFLLFGEQRNESPLLQPDTGLTAAPPASVSTTEVTEQVPRTEVFDEPDSQQTSHSSASATTAPVESLLPGHHESSQGNSVNAAVARASRDSAGVYSPEIAEVMGRNVPDDLHSRFETEDREDSWASYMEEQFAAYFADRPALAQFNIPLIHCRTSICEVHAIGYGPDAYVIWTGATAGIQYEPWHDFRRLSVSTKDVEPGVLGIVLILAKAAE